MTRLCHSSNEILKINQYQEFADLADGLVQKSGLLSHPLEHVAVGLGRERFGRLEVGDAGDKSSVRLPECGGFRGSGRSVVVAVETNLNVGEMIRNFEAER